MSLVDQHPQVAAYLDRACLGTEGGPMETKTDTLVERVEKLVHAQNPPLVWGNPRLSSTPRSLAIEELAARTEALEDAVREIAYEVQKLSDPS